MSRPSRISASSSTTRIVPLGMNGLPCGGKFQVERGASPRRGANVNLTSVLLDNAVADRKSQSRSAAVALRREEGIEAAMDVLAGDTGAGVRDFNLHRAILPARADLQHAPAGHGVAGILQETEADLLQLLPRPAHGCQPVIQMPDP